MRALFVAIALSVSVSPAGAQGFAVMGVGVSTCAKFATDFKQDPREWEGYYFAWAQGYMSGLNIMMPGVNYRRLDAKTIDVQKRAIREYCDARPLADFQSAVDELFKTLPMTTMTSNN